MKAVKKSIQSPKVIPQVLKANELAEIENVAAGTLSNFHGDDGDDDDDDDDYSGYIGVNDEELDDPDSGFLGHKEIDSTQVLSLTFRNENPEELSFYLNPGFKNTGFTGFKAGTMSQASDAGFVSIENGNKRIKGSGDANCTLDQLVLWIQENPTAISGFRVQATSLPNEAGVMAVGAAESQFRKMAISLRKVGIFGDQPAQLVKPGLGVSGNTFNVTIAESNTPFQLDNQTEARINLVGMVQITIDFYFNNSLNRAKKFARMHATGIRNIRNRSRR
jgi:hypothetical protein